MDPQQEQEHRNHSSVGQVEQERQNRSFAEQVEQRELRTRSSVEQAGLQERQNQSSAGRVEQQELRSQSRKHWIGPEQAGQEPAEQLEHPNQNQRYLTEPQGPAERELVGLQEH